MRDREIVQSRVIHLSIGMDGFKYSLTVAEVERALSPRAATAVAVIPEVPRRERARSSR